jgi:catechol 2,3-dioxygenase-like lactoylglutathione lyase family enzyme
MTLRGVLQGVLRPAAERVLPDRIATSRPRHRTILNAMMPRGSVAGSWRGVTPRNGWRIARTWLRPHLAAFSRLTTSNSRELPAWPAAHDALDTRNMTIKRLDHVSVVVDDLVAAIAFFTALGMTIEGKAKVEGPWVDRINRLEGVQVDIVMMRTPDGHGRLELTKFHNPALVAIDPAIGPPNAPGLRSVMFTVDSVDDTVARLRAIGAELVGEVAQYEDAYRLCYMRGPAGIIVALAEELS